MDKLLQHKITNIKISLKTDRDYQLQEIKNILNVHSIKFKDHSNFLVFKIFSFVVSIFKTQIKKEANLNHINITKLRLPHHIKYVIRGLICLGIGIARKNYTVDNICAKADFCHRIDLLQFAQLNKNLCIKYHNEIFPGLFIKFTSVTLIIFKSGKIVCVGAKKEQYIQEKLNYLFVKLQECII